MRKTVCCTINRSSVSLLLIIDVMGDLSSLFCGIGDRVYSPILYLGGGAAIGTDLNEGSSLYLRLGFLNSFPFKQAGT